MFAVARIKKYKSSAVGHIQEHNKRETKQYHTDQSKQHLNHHWSFNNLSFADAIKQKIEQLATNMKRKQRADAVVAVELVLTASPEFFRPGRAEKWGEFEPEKVKAFSKAPSIYGNVLK